MRTPLLIAIRLSCVTLPLCLAACTEPRPGNTTSTTAASPPPATPATAAAPAQSAAASSAAETPAFDIVNTSAGPLKITPIQHASVLFEFAGSAIYVDPWSQAPLDGRPKADFVFITDIHQDHLDPAAIDKLKKPTTVLVGPPAVNAKQAMGVVIANGESHDFGAFKAEAVPMYNLSRGPEAGKLFHDKGRGDGYVLTFGGTRVYLSGDTECIPEMKALKSIDVAFVCMNLPYTMPPSEAAECVKAFSPKIVYPYHYRGQDVSTFSSMVNPAGKSSIEVRLRKWY